MERALEVCWLTPACRRVEICGVWVSEFRVNCLRVDAVRFHERLDDGIRQEFPRSWDRGGTISSDFPVVGRLPAASSCTSCYSAAFRKWAKSGSAANPEGANEAATGSSSRTRNQIA